MTITVGDDAIASDLEQAVGADVELRARDGRLLGRFIPTPRPGMMFPELGKTDAELDRIENDPTARWYTADEVMAHIRSLGNAG